MDSFDSYLLRKLYKETTKHSDKLTKTEKMINWEAFRPILQPMYHNKTHRGGRPNMDPVLMVKLLILYACETLASASKTSWNNVFDGLHGICGYDSDLHTDPVTGGAAADEFTSGDSVYDAWVDATMFSGHQDDTAAIYAVTIRIDSVNYDYWDDDLDDPLPDYDGSCVFKYGYTYDSWGCT